MKSIRSTVLSTLALALLGPCLANAQGLTGKFNLPFEARWGLATLREMQLPCAGLVLYDAPHKFRHGSAQEERQTAQVR